MLSTPDRRMSQIFLSYAREDRQKAELLADVLSRRGWSVWWDRAILPGRSFEDDIERQVQEARVIVVLWSRAAVASEWVRNEAAEGRKRGILVPARLDDATIPLSFRGVQTADLLGWDGDAGHAELRQLIRAVEGLLASGSVDAQPPGANAPNGPGSVPRSSSALEGIALRMALSFAAGMTYPSVPSGAGYLIGAAMAGVCALAVWSRVRRRLGPALLALELEVSLLAMLFAAGITLERGAFPWAEWPDLVKHFWPALLRGWIILALFAGAAQVAAARFSASDGVAALGGWLRKPAHSTRAGTFPMVRGAGDTKHSLLSLVPSATAPLRLGAVSVHVTTPGGLPEGLDAIVYEEDTFLVMSTESVLEWQHDHPLRVLHSARTTEPEPLGSVVLREGKPLRLLAVVHDLGADPVCTEGAVQAALRRILTVADSRQVLTLGMPLPGVAHGRLPRESVLRLITDELALAPQYPKSVWIMVPHGDEHGTRSVMEAYGSGASGQPAAGTSRRLDS
jgi:hypothetical protein